MKQFIGIILLLMLIRTGAAQSTSCKVFLVREGMHEGSAVSCSIFKEEELLCKLNNKRYSVHEINPGKYIFHAQWGGNKPNNDKRGDLTLTLEEGKTYYLKFNSVSKAFNGYVGLLEVTETTFKTLESLLKLDDKCL